MTTSDNGDYLTRRHFLLWNRIIAANEIAGGIGGLVLMALNAAEIPVVFAVIFAVFLFASLIAGALLWRGERSSSPLSMVVQAAQVIGFTSPLFTYAYIAGLNVRMSVMVVNSTFRVGGMAGFHTLLQMHVGRPPDSPDFALAQAGGIFLSLNIVAAAALAFLVYQKLGPSNTTAP
jgi:hypothetical protein